MRAIGSAGPRQLSYFGVDLTGRRLTGTDAEVSVGGGPVEVPLTAKEILLVITGRRPLAGAPDPAARDLGRRG